MQLIIATKFGYDINALFENVCMVSFFLVFQFL